MKGQSTIIIATPPPPYHKKPHLEIFKVHITLPKMLPLRSVAVTHLASKENQLKGKCPEIHARNTTLHVFPQTLIQREAHNSGADLILRGGGVLGRNSSRGG